MSENELFVYDVRLQDRFLADGTLEPAAHKKHLDSLPDLAEKCEEFDLEQPALAKEQVEAPAPALAEAVQPPGPPVASFVQPLAPATEVTPPPSPAAAPPPAPAPTSFGAPVAAPPQPAPPAPSEESAPKPPAHHDSQPASIPPPTASVDADWGDS